MRIRLAALLAALVASSPALALDRNVVGPVVVHYGSPGASSWHGVDRPFGDLGCDSRRRGHDGKGHRRGGSSCTVFADSWGYPDPDFNRSWDADSYNDWWHDRPDRAFPRWVQHNEGCPADRMWWSGSGWHC
jgi:hypothetical protein